MGTDASLAWGQLMLGLMAESRGSVSMCDDHPNLVKAGPQGPITPVLLSEVQFYTVLRALLGGYQKEIGRRMLWATCLCVVYEGVHWKRFLLHTLSKLPIRA